MWTSDIEPQSGGAAHGTLGFSQRDQTDETDDNDETDETYERNETDETLETDETEEHESSRIRGTLKDDLQEIIIAKLPIAKLFQMPVLSKAWRARFRSSQTFRAQVTAVSHRWPLFCPVYFDDQGTMVGYNAAAQRWETLFSLSSLCFFLEADEMWKASCVAGSLVCFALRNTNKRRELFRIKQRTAPISRDLYGSLPFKEYERTQTTTALIGSDGLPFWHPRSEGYLPRFYEFSRRMKTFCMADTWDDAIHMPEETKDLYDYVTAGLDQDSLKVDEVCDMYLVNAITKEWKLLPCPPSTDWPDHIVQLVVDGPNAYKIIVMRFHGGARPFLIQIYDSRTDSWELKNSTAAVCTFEMYTVKPDVYLNSAGILFIIANSFTYVDGNRYAYEILAYKAEDNSWTNIPVPEASRPSIHNNRDSFKCGLVKCGTEVLLLTAIEKELTSDREYRLSTTLSIYSLEIELMTFVFFCGGPCEEEVDDLGVADIYLIEEAVGGGDCLYLGRLAVNQFKWEFKPILMFNIRSKSWTTIGPASQSQLPRLNRLGSSPFQPGLNPFLILRTERVSSSSDTGGPSESAPAHTDVNSITTSAYGRPPTAMEGVD